MRIPTLEEVVEQMKAVSGAQDLDPDAPLYENADIDSLDMMEWLYEFQEQYPEIGASESVFEDVGDATTFRGIYDQIMAPALAGAGSGGDPA